MALSLQPRPSAARTTRAIVSATLANWEIPSLTEDVSLVTTELITNALRHGAPPDRGTWEIGLRLVLAGGILVCLVSDSSSRPPVLRDPDQTTENGRGMRLVAAHCDRWGWLPCRCEMGKMVWALFTQNHDLRMAESR